MSSDLGEALVIKRPTLSDGKLNKGFSQKPPIKTKNNFDEQLAMNPRLKFNDYYPIIKERFKRNSAEILKVLNTFDLEQSGIVTKGELRRVLDRYCLPLTTGQYDTLLETIPIAIKNGSVNYNILTNHINDTISSTNNQPITNETKLPHLRRSHTTIGLTKLSNSNEIIRSSLSSSHSNRSSISSRQSTARNWTYSVFNIDDLIPILQAKIFQNVEGLLRALRLFDFNSDHYIQKFRLKKVLENFCCGISDHQFDRLIEKFAFSDGGSINYIEFLKNMGIPLNLQGKIDSTKKTNQLKVGSNTEMSQINKIALTPSGLIGIGDMELMMMSFRKIVEEKFNVLKKAFFVLDSKAEGFVSIDQLFQVISNFVFPLSENVFNQIMDRCSIKATGKVSWLNFLKKFQDPQSKNVNGITFPSKSEHIVNPIKGTDNSVSMDDLLERLCHHISNNFSSFKEAFLQLNKTHKGKITKTEFIRILKKFQFNIQQNQINMLFQYLDPNKRGFISYHNFLQLFEEKESLAGHKWLNSNHKVVDVKTDLKLTDDVIRTSLYQNMTAKWPELVAELKIADPNSTGYISMKKLKKLFHKLFNYLHDEDIEKLVANLKMTDISGKINYKELLNSLGIDPAPTDTEGISSQIIESNKDELRERAVKHNKKLANMDLLASKKTVTMATEELLIRIRDKLLQSRSSAYEIFRKYEAKDGKGGVNEMQLKKILDSFNFTISPTQMDEICSITSFPRNPNRRIDFNGFLTCFIDNIKDLPALAHLDQSACYLPHSNHHVNAIRGGDQQILNADDIEAWIRKQVTNGYSDLWTAFQKLDSTDKGHITKKDLKHLVDVHNVAVDDDVFDDVCKKLGVLPNTRLTYKDFLNRFQLVDDIETGHKWLNSQHRFNDIDGKSNDLSADFVVKILADKIHQVYNEKGSAFAHIVSSGKGFISYANFQELLQKLGISMNKEEMRKLWKMYDITGAGRLNYMTFIDSMGLSNEFSADDKLGFSSQIIQGSHDALVDHLASQEIKHQQSTQNQANIGASMNVEHLFDNIKRHLKINYADLSVAFKSVAGSRSLTGSITLDDVNRLLNQMHLFVPNHRFIQLAARIGYRSPDDTLSYDKFCAVFQDKISSIGGVSSHLIAAKEPSKPNVVMVEEAASDMSTEKIVIFIKKKIIQQLTEIRKTFYVMDKEKIGFVTTDEFRNLITSFCISLSDTQFNKYLRTLSLYCQDVSSHDGAMVSRKFDYEAFLKQFSLDQDNDTIPLLSNMDLVESKTNQLPLKLNYQQSVDYIYESIKARPKLFLNTLKQKDYAMIGKISKKDFQDTMEQLVFKLTHENFDKFWQEQNPNEFENIDYLEFIKRISGYSIDQDNTDADRNKSRPVTSQSQISVQAESFDNFNDFDENEQMRRKLEKLLNKHWQLIFSKCRNTEKCNQNDTNNVPTGLVSIEDFCKILNDFDTSITMEALKNLNLYRTLSTNRNIRYGDLIRSVVLSSRGSIVSQDNAVDVQRRFDAVGIKTTSSDGTRSYFTLIYKLRRHILENWKQLRHDFLNCDKQQSDTVTANQCMRILNRHCGTVSADLFYHLMTIYDNGQGKFNYRQFIECFLKTANKN